MATPKTQDGAKTFEGEGLANFFRKKAALEQAARSGAANGAALTVPLDRLDDNPFQPRGAMDEGPLEELVASIARHGLLQAITVRRLAERFQVIAGHRRVAAFRLLKERAVDADKPKYSAVPAQEKLEVTDEQMALYALVENLQRDDLDAVEAAAGLANYRDAEGLSVEELAERTGLELRRLQRLLQLHAAPKIIKEGVTNGVLVPAMNPDGKPAVTTAGTERRERRKLELMAAIEFSRLYRAWEKVDLEKAPRRIEALVQRALVDGWTLRRIQAHCQSALKGRADAGEGVASEPPRPPPFEDSSKRLVVYRDRLSSLTADEHGVLRSTLKSLLEALG